MSRPYVWALQQSGATDGQVVTWDDALGMFVPADPAGGGSIDDLSDVDTSTTAPTDGQALLWDNTSGLWIPGDLPPATNGLPTGGAAGQVLTKIDGTDFNADWETPSSSGSASFTDLGKTTPGATQETFGDYLAVMKKVTVPSGGGVILGVSVYVKNPGGAVGEMAAAVWADSAGSPTQMVGILPAPPVNSLYLDTTFRWLTFPVIAYVPAGDVWIGVFNRDATTGTGIRTTYDTGGSDKTYTTVAANGWIADADNYTLTTTSKNYSIKARLLQV